jgi:hypothetical protein
MERGDCDGTRARSVTEACLDAAKARFDVAETCLDVTFENDIVLAWREKEKKS